MRRGRQDTQSALLTELSVVLRKRCYVTELLTQLAPPHPTTIFFFHFYQKEQLTDELLLFRCRHLQTLFQKWTKRASHLKGRWLGSVCCLQWSWTFTENWELSERSIFHSEPMPSQYSDFCDNVGGDVKCDFWYCVMKCVHFEGLRQSCAGQRSLPQAR